MSNKNEELIGSLDVDHVWSELSQYGGDLEQAQQKILAYKEKNVKNIEGVILYSIPHLTEDY